MGCLPSHFALSGECDMHIRDRQIAVVVACSRWGKLLVRVASVINKRVDTLC
jgi:hypothetical protein